MTDQPIACGHQLSNGDICGLNANHTGWHRDGSPMDGTEEPPDRNSTRVARAWNPPLDADDVATWIMAIPNPNHAVVKAQVQMLVNTYVGELERLAGEIAELRETAERQAETLMRCGQCGELYADELNVVCDPCDDDQEKTIENLRARLEPAKKPSPIKGRVIPVREMIRFLHGCDPDHDIWVTTNEDMKFDTEKMSLVTGYAYEDQDDEMSRSSGRKYNGQPFLRRPILRVEKND